MADSVIRTCDLALFFRKLTGIFMLKSMLDYCQVQLKDHFFIFMIFRNIIKNKNFCLMTMLDTCMTEACIYIWASEKNFIEACMCALRKLRSLCASAQADLSFRRAFCGSQGSKASSSWRWRLRSTCADDRSLCRTHLQSYVDCCVPAPL